MLGKAINKTQAYSYVVLFLLYLPTKTPRTTPPASPSQHQGRTVQSHHHQRLLRSIKCYIEVIHCWK